MKLDTLELRGFAAGGEIEVPCDAIDAALNRLWRKMARGHASDRGEPLLRACLLNLVVHAGDPASEVVARFLAASLTDRFPARILLVRARPDEPGSGPPHAFVAASRSPDRDGAAAHVAGELVILDARGGQLAHVPAVIRAALEPELTTTLWWTGPPPRPQPYVAALLELADRVVVDSESLPDAADIAHLLPPEGDVRLADLAWPRLAPWRTALARAFDPPANRALLGAIDGVHVVVGAASGRLPAASSAPLLAGWLAAALGWRACDPCGREKLRFRKERGGCDVVVTVAARRAPHEGIDEVAISAGPDRVVLRRAPGGLVEVAGPPSFARVRPAPLVEPAPEDVLAAALLATGADPIAPEAIRRATPRRGG